MDTNQDASGENTQLSSSNDFPIDSSGENLQSLPKNAIPYGNTYVEQYKAAAKSLRDNKFLAILPVFMISKETVDKLRSMQATYLCRQQHRIDLGFGFLLATVWDHDRLWVSRETGIADFQILTPDRASSTSGFGMVPSVSMRSLAQSTWRKSGSLSGEAREQTILECSTRAQAVSASPDA